MVVVRQGRHRVLIIVVLLIHFIVNHALVSGGLLTNAVVAAYYRNPVIPIMEIAFLALVVAHSLIGLVRDHFGFAPFTRGVNRHQLAL